MTIGKRVLAATSVAALVAMSGTAYAATVFMDPFASSVDTTDSFDDVSQSGPFNVSLDNTYRFDSTDAFGTADDGGALFAFEFTADTVPADIEYTFTINAPGDFSDLVFVWSDDENLDEDEDFVVRGDQLGIQDTFTFTGVPRYLVVGYSDVSAGGNLDIKVEGLTPIPLPAAGVLLLGALGGLTALRRKRTG